MTAGTDESDTLREILGEEAAARGGAHPELELLAGYHDGALDNEATERMRDHLAGCRRCADRLLDLAPLLRPDAPAEDGVAELAIESAWRRFRALAAGVEPRAGGARSRRLTALAASLAVATLTLGLWGLRLQQANSALRLQVAEASAPVVNMPQLYLEEATRSGALAAAVFDVPASASHFGIFFTVTDPGPADEYSVRFRDAKGRVALEVDGLVMSNSGSLRLGLPRGLLAAGDYLIQLRGLSGGEWHPVVEYRRAIRYPDRPTIPVREAGPRAP